MRGDLSETSAADACRAIAGSGSTGVLMIDGPDGSGTITIVDGSIAGATSPIPRARLGDRLVGAGFLEESALREALETQRESGDRMRLGALLVERTQVPRDAIRLFVQEQTLDALFELVRWRYGSFDFVSGTPAAVPEIPVVMRVDDALLEVSRRHEEWGELSEVIPDLEAVPVFPANPTSAAASLEPDEFAVLASVDGERSVRDLASDLGYSEFELARIVYGLVLLGVIEIHLPEDEIGSALDDAFASLARMPEPADQSAPEEASLPTGQRGTAPADLGFFAAPVSPRSPTAEQEAPEAGEASSAAEADEAGADDDSSVVESELPERSTSDVLRELRGFDAQITSDEDEDARALEHDGAPEPPTPDPDTVDHPDGADVGAAFPPPRRTASPREDADGDVAEFLRELSRLALDEEAEATPERPRRPSPGPDPRGDDGRRKRRGLFGR